MKKKSKTTPKSPKVKSKTTLYVAAVFCLAVLISTVFGDKDKTPTPAPEPEPTEEYTLDGIENNSSSGYRSNEKLIVKFVNQVNKKCSQKIVSVNFLLNHEKAYIGFGDFVYTIWTDRSGEYNVHVQKELNNGKATVDLCDEEISAMIYVLSEGYDDAKIASIIKMAKTEGKYTDEKVSVKYNYTEIPVGYQEGDHYWIDVYGYDYTLN